MVELAAHLTDNVISRLKMRQWVITFPYDIRYLMAWNNDFRSQILGAVMRALQRHYQQQAKKQGGRDPKYAAISVLQRMDSACRLNVHWHILAADGAWCETAEGVEFLPAPPLKQAVVQQVFEDILRRIDRQISRLGDPDENPGRFLNQRDPAFAALLRNAMLGNQTEGKDAGKPQRVEFKPGPRDIKPHGHNCCQTHGFSLHANRTVAPQDRAGLEKLCKYLCRPAVPASRLELVDNPKDNKTIRVNLKSEWAGGIHAVVVSPRDLVIRALAQIPLPFRKAIIYHGAFAGNAAIRSQIVPDGPVVKRRRKRKACGHRHVHETTKLTWSEALKRSFGWDLLACPCGGTRRVIAAVQEPKEIERFLRHLQLLEDAGEVVSVRGPPELFDFDEIERQADEDDFYETLAVDKALGEDWPA